MTAVWVGLVVAVALFWASMAAGFLTNAHRSDDGGSHLVLLLSSVISAGIGAGLVDYLIMVGSR